MASSGYTSEYRRGGAVVEAPVATVVTARPAGAQLARGEGATHAAAHGQEQERGPWQGGYYTAGAEHWGAWSVWLACGAASEWLLLRSGVSAGAAVREAMQGGWRGPVALACGVCVYWLGEPEQLRALCGAAAGGRLACPVQCALAESYLRAWRECEQVEGEQGVEAARVYLGL